MRRSEPAARGLATPAGPLATRAGLPAVFAGLLALGCGTQEPPAEIGAAVERTGGDAPIVAGYEALRVADAADDAARGELLLGELGCVACHPAADPAVAARVGAPAAPDLTDVGRRVTAGWLAGFVTDPQSAEPGTTMPNVLAGLADADRVATAGQIAQFLLDRGGALADARHGAFRFRASVERGRELFHTVGCVACHSPEEGDAGTVIPSVPLPDLAAKTSVAALAAFLLDPEATRPGGRMPSLYLSEAEARDLAVYLLREQAPPEIDRVAGFEFEYFLDPMQDEDAEGFFTRPPAVFDDLVVEGTGRIAALSLELPIETSWGNHLFRFSGLLPVARPGTYEFVLSSDRRSRSELLIDGRPVATKPREVGREITAEVDLEAGDHAVEVTYSIRGDTREPFVDVTATGEGLERPTPLQRLVVVEDVELATTLPATLDLDEAGVEEGARAFVSLGCAACHERGAGGRAIAAEAALTASAPAGRAPMTAPALENLDITRAEWHGGPGTPRYALADHQREAIVVALSDATRLAVARGPSDAAVQALAAYNCYGCHLRGDAAGTVGGPDAVRGAYFAVAPGLDLGDEGRLPPTLTGVGGRLKPTALASVLTESRLHVRRDTMITRMPRFGGELLSGLAAALAAADARPGDLEEPPFTAEAIAAGRALVGDQGLRCMTCHDVGVYPAQGVSTIDMASFYERLRPGWFRRFLPDPAAFNDATRMPTFWPDGRVVHPDLADGTVAGQVDAIYSYVSLGPSMPAPSGMDIGDAMVLAPTDEPIVFRTFMAEAGPRAIVVGYPESVHVAFDANVIRLAKAWRGGFFDARGTWSGRAGRFLDPYGDDVLEMPPGPALAFLDSLEEPWPTAARTDRDVGGRWLGYRLDSQRRPVFRYRLGGVEIEEQPVPALSPGGADLTRRFNLEAGQVAASGSLYLLLGEGEEISRGDDGSWSIDGRVRVELAAGTPASPIVRTSQGVQQLLVPIGITAGGTTAIDVLISW